MSALFYFFLLFQIKGSVSLTVSTPFEIYVLSGINSSIVLNCTYKDERYNNIFTIIWYKKENDKYKRLAAFSSHGASCGDTDLKNRSSCVGYGPNSTSAIMYINDVRCEDDGEYKCVVTIFENNQEEFSNTTVYVQAKEEIPKAFTMQPNNSLEENKVVNFSCLANVGNPEGVVRIWKQRNDFKKELLGESSFTDNSKENCSTFSHLTLHYNLSRHDHGAIFWCSSQNKMTMVPARSREIGPVEIFYGPANVSIAVLPDKTTVYVGDRVRLTCVSDGNPRPRFQWTFNSTNIVGGKKYHLSDDNSTIEFNIDNITDNGYYYCIASNIINGKRSNMHMSVRVKIVVNEKTVSPPEDAKSCLDIVCSFTEKCYSEKNTAYCSTDAWKIVACLFITISIVLGIATASLWLYLKLIKPRKSTVLDGAIGRDDVQRNYESLGSGNTNRDLEERNYESLSGGITNTYSTINDTALSRDGEERPYESLSGGETHTYTSITRGGSM